MAMTDEELKDLFSRDDGAILLKLLAAQHQEQVRNARKAYDYSHPVDEYAWGAMPTDAEIMITPNWQFSVRIESITASLPVGITSATLQLGDRRIPLLSAGAATTALTLVSLTNLGIIIGEQDLRQLVVTGTPTSNFYIGLCGHGLERTGNK